MSREQTWASNHTQLAANTPAAIGPGPGTVIHRITVTATLTGSLAVYDNQTAASGPLLLNVATPAAGAQYVIEQRVKNGCWVVPGTAGTCSVSWD